jgi:integrase/recombinase XerC
VVVNEGVHPDDVEQIDAFSKYQFTRGFSFNTVRRRRTALAGFARYMAPQHLVDAVADDADEWLAQWTYPATRAAYRGDLAAFYKWAHRRRIITSNPMLDVDPVKVKKTLPRPAPEDAIARAYTVADGDTQVMILLGALAGLRRSEIAKLDRQDVHLEAEPPVIHVVDGKGGKDRIVPIHPTLLEHLARRTCWLYRAHATKLSPDAVGARLSAALSTPDQRVVGHQLRHFFGTEAARWSGGDVVLVGKLMGHSAPGTTMGYIAWNPTAGYDVVAKIPTAGVDDEVTTRRRLRSA